MICAIEIAMTVFGIITLIKGEIWLSKTNSVRGIPAYIIGALLTATMPLALVIGFALGFFSVLLGEGEPASPFLALIDVGVVVGIGVVVALIGFPNAKPREVAPRSAISPASPLSPGADDAQAEATTTPPYEQR